MSKTTSAIRMINSTIRTLLMATVVGVVGFAGYQAYVAYSGPRMELAGKQRELEATLESLQQAQDEIARRDEAIASLNDEIADRDVRIDELEEDLDRVQTAIRLLKLRRRIARIEVLDQSPAEDGMLETSIRFVEIGDDGQRIGEPAEFTIEGDRVYVEYLVVKFDDKYVEDADIERGTAICLFERIFGENQEPGEGFVVDRVGSRPTAYDRGTPMSELEQKIWNDFWTIANDRDKAAELGIRATHAQAPSMRVRPGNTYELDLRATGEFSLNLIDEGDEQ